MRSDHRQALAEAQAWVVSRLGLGNPAEALRSEELGAYLSGYLDSWYGEIASPQEIETLIARRRELLKGVNLPQVSPKGRILCAFSDWDTTMGEGTIASEGIVDDTYFPAWDTWFAVLDLNNEPEGETYVLLAWIPEELTELVENAIAVGATQPIGWLDEAVSGVWPDMSGYLYIDEGYPEASRAALVEVLKALNPS